jgi:hypothetical protein
MRYDCMPGIAALAGGVRGACRHVRSFVPSAIVTSLLSRPITQSQPFAGFAFNALRSRQKRLRHSEALKAVQSI